MTNYAIHCSSSITQTNDGIAICQSGWTATVATIPFELNQIDPSVATAMFGAGFGLFIAPWAAAWGFSQLLKLLR